MNFNKSFYSSILRWRISREFGKKTLKPIYCSNVASIDESYNIMIQILQNNASAMICRWGSLELIAITNILSVRHHLRMHPSARRTYKLCQQAGFFPNEPSLMYNFTDLMLECFSDTNCVGVWNDSIELPLEDYIVNNYAPDAKIIPMGCVSPVYWEKPWSSILQGQKVLVVSPFTESIKKQYARRNMLFTDADTRLPKFELKTLKAVLSLAWEQTSFATWFDALKHMRQQMETIDFDIALIGAGAYGMPLAAYAKRMGKKGVHIGGSLQLMFGILGGRWDKVSFPGECRENWIRPSENETPRNKELVEGGCYW
jgi:hypothetical protein